MTDTPSRLDQITGYVLLLDFLDEDREGWLRFFETSMTGSELVSDEAFSAWVGAERARDPGLISRTREVLARFRGEVIRGWTSRDRQITR